MNQFIKFLFASCLGTALALGLLFVIGISWIVGMAESANEQEKVQVSRNSILELDFKMPIPEKTNNLPMDPFDLEQQDILGLTDMVTAIRQAKDDPDIKGIYLNSSIVMLGKATSASLRNALEDFKSSGKFVVAYAHYYTQGAYYLASVADSVWMSPQGVVDFRGYSSTITYYKGLLDKLDVQMRIFYCGKYKSATEPFRTDHMSEENRLQIREYLNPLYDIMIKDISRNRNIPEAELRQIAERFDGFNAEKAVQNRLVDRFAYEDEVFAMIRAKIGLEEKDKLNRVDVEDYFKAKGKKTNFSVKDKIAVVYAEGEIHDGDQGEPGTILDGKYVKMLRKIRKDPQIKAIVLRVNSPGGSSLASENILRELDLCKKAGKPVVVSMGDVAASGGYYIACHADSIFAEPATITGSIGVFGMIPILDKTMRNKLGITFDTVRTQKFSAFGSAVYDFSPEESQIIQSRVDWIYQDFLKKVAEGRKRSPEQIHEIAQGRVWSAGKAKEIGLVDDLGGLDRAIAAAAKLANLEKYRTAEYPQTKSGLEQFIDQLTHKKDRDDNVRAWALRQELGEFYPLYKTVKGIKQNNGILFRMPYDLSIN
ncbi:MAG TPA: signal peptide peptidase SppA [Saprospiraceae bacterium]|nr:signal peptide peptidase SppA [Saprospiraceae bacterium]